MDLTVTSFRNQDGTAPWIRRIFALLMLLNAGVSPDAGAGTASDLFRTYKQNVFQIRVIDIASGNKSSIGSGFQISGDGLVATNFHVVASYVHKPKRYRLEAVNHSNETDDVELVGIDVIHDLALVKLKRLRQGFFRFSTGVLSKGDRVYSMGNPHDLGMTIVEGNYNGLIKTSRYRKILFSGSLNPGMSGGPAIDSSGRVIGINVSKGGEQLSFLVPVRKLVMLLKQVRKNGKTVDYEKDIARSLVGDQDRFYNRLLSGKWKSESFMELVLPGSISESLKCWGHSLDKKDLHYNGVQQHCRSQDRIFVNKRLSTGGLFYDYEWISTEKLNRFQFYSLVQERFNHGSLGNASDEEDITNFTCNTSFIEISEHAWRASSCVRAYKKYEGLYDTTFLLASVDENNKGVVIKLGAAGISKSNAKKLARAFIEAVQWPR